MSKLMNFDSPQTAHSPAVNRVGRFIVSRELGRGTVGTVYLANDPIIDRHVALKTFSAKLTAKEKKICEQQFINEARAAGRLSHPNIVTIFEASSEGSTAYIAMEYLQGKELSKFLDHGTRFKPDDVASIMWKLADALDYAHKNGVVHRDIKPDNIFMVGDNQPKIVDFGIARAPSRVSDQLENDAPYTMFRENNLLGTPYYMSPEQALGRPVDSRTDIYSLGAVMYEMLTGSKPFQSSDTEKVLHLVAYKAPAPPHELDRNIPAMLSQIAMRAMSKRIEKRYQHAEEMALDIKRYMVREKRSRQRILTALMARGSSEDLPSVSSARFASSSSSHSSGAAPRGTLFWIAVLAIVGAAVALSLLR